MASPIREMIPIDIQTAWFVNPDGKKQLGRYLDRLGLNQGYLVIFDPGKKSWKEKLYYKQISYEQKKIIMVGL